MDPISERILTIVETKLATILKSNGYKTDAGRHVLRCRPQLDKMPCLVVWEQSESAASTDFESATNQTLTFTVEAYLKADFTQTGKILGLIRADVKKCLGGAYKRREFRDDDTPAGKCICALKYDGSVAHPREVGAATDGSTMTFIANYPEAIGNPYGDN